MKTPYIERQMIHFRVVHKNRKYRSMLRLKFKIAQSSKAEIANWLRQNNSKNLP